LNLDPRYRAVASLGTRVVQQHQEALVASAWDQSAAIRDANRLLRQAQMARTVGEVIHGRIIGPRALPPDRLLQLTRPVHHQFRAVGAASPTVATAIEVNRGVRAAVSVPFRRIGRPRGPVARRLAPGPLPAPVARLGLPAGDPLALRPTPELTAFRGTVGLETVASGLGFASLTASLVLEPRLAWEAGVTTVAPSRKVPHAFLSDLVVTTQQRPEFGWQQPITSAAIGRALDFDGAPQLGWEPLDRPPVFPVGFGTWEEGYAANFVEFGPWRGLLAIRRSTWWANRNVFSGTIEWTGGYMLETHNPTDTAPADPILGELLRGLAIAGADLADADRLDVVVVWSDESEFPIGMSMSQRMTKTFIVVGLDFDPAAGTFAGGWSTPRELEEGGGPYSLAASGSQIFLLRDRNLRIETLTSTGAVASSTIVDLGPVLPEDYAGGAIAAADFGGGTGVDLLVYYVAGGGASLRAGYRVAFEVQADGSIGAWGDPMPAPVHTAGPEVGVLLGPADPETTARRVATTEAFREAAAATQSRQTRIAALAAPPPPAPDVDATSLVGDVEEGLDVPTRVAETVHARLSLARPIDPASVGDMLQPLALSPRFPYPTYELFRDAFQDRLFPGASTLPDDSVAALLVNDDAMESFLVGMNHEMSRELLWRDYPLRGGTYFQRFWDGRRDDIDPIDRWADGSALGDHEPAATPTASMLLVVRAELIRRIPDVTIYAAPARPGDSGSGRTPDLGARKDPLFGGHLHPDIRFFGFDLTEDEVRGAGPSDGWYFVFQESPTGRRFGLNESLDRFGTTPPTWNELDWSQLAADRAAFDGLVHAHGGSGSRLRDVSLPDGGESILSHRWGFSAAHMAHITLQRPVQVAIHGSDLLETG
jgi:hypothetical protein